jgi:hypothetical protein
MPKSVTADYVDENGFIVRVGKTVDVPLPTSANGAISIQAWGTAPRNCAQREIGALNSAIQFG